MSELSVVDRGNHCEIHQGDAIAADYVSSKRLAVLFAASAAMMDALRIADDALDYAQAQVEDERDRQRLLHWRAQVQSALALAEGRE